MPFANAYRGKRVLVTGHTGFKGAWLTEWLLDLGAEVSGVALAPPTEPALFDQLGLTSKMDDRRVDIRDFEALRKIVAEVRPEFVFHLAAQPLVRLSYDEPLRTYTTNIIGTANLLEAVRQSKTACSIVGVTTDKCYRNNEWVHGYREEDQMGGDDPYSSSKGAAELVIHAYRKSYFSRPDSPVRLASARAGNVVGGGDWALDRIVPDCMRALQRNDPIPVRNKTATRPWQHVLEPLSGYLWLAAKLSASDPPVTSNPLPVTPAALAAAFNFGPGLTSNRTVADFVQEVLKHAPGRWEDRSDPKAVHEASLLNLVTDKAHHLLNWQPVWKFEQTVAETVAWYRSVAENAASATKLTQQQISQYTSDARGQGLAWAS